MTTLDQMDAGVEETARKALELLDSQPIPPGEYECVCGQRVAHAGFQNPPVDDYRVPGEGALIVKKRGRRLFYGGAVVHGHQGAGHVLLETPSSGMEDPKNWGIQCMVTTAREIKDGRLTGKLYSPIVLTGYRLMPQRLNALLIRSIIFTLPYCQHGRAPIGHAASMDDPRLDEELKGAYYAAQFAANPYFDLPDPVRAPLAEQWSP